MTGEMVSSELCKANFGRAPQEELTYKAVLNAVADEDRPAMREAVRHAMEQGEDYEIEHRIEWPDGSEHWILARGRCFYDDNGEPSRMIGVTQDISERKNAEAERERLLERERKISHTLQRSLLPPSLPDIPGVELANRYVAFGEGMEVGGDFYDVFSVPGDHWALAVGDVTGKGPEAATLTSLARYTIRAAAAREVGDPGRVLSILNEEILRQIGSSRMVTVIFGELEPAAAGWTLSLATGGHPPPFILRASGEVESCGYGAGAILGAFEDPHIGGWEILLRPGDAALLYTDGATEARAPAGEFFGEERLEQVCAECASLSAEEIAARIERAVVEFQRGNPRDDVALLVVKIPGGEASG